MAAALTPDELRRRAATANGTTVNRRLPAATTPQGLLGDPRAITTPPVPGLPQTVDQHVNRVISKNNPLMQTARTQGVTSAARRGLINSSIAGQAGQQAVIDTALPIASQNSQQEQQRYLLGSEQQQQRYLQGEQFKFEGGQAEATRALQEKLSGLDRAAQERIAKMNVASNDREKASAFAAQAETTYSQTVASINGMVDLPLKVREQYLANAAAVRDSQLAMVEQFYGIKLSWGPATAPPPSPPPGGNGNSNDSPTATSRGGNVGLIRNGPAVSAGYVPGRYTYESGGNRVRVA